MLLDEMTGVPDFVRDGINLASSGLGATSIGVTDEFFAPVSRMLDEAPAIFIPDKYDDNGKWMDGWESRRRRRPGHDAAVVRLASPGQIHGFDVDTSHFTGNYPPACSIEACRSQGDPDAQTLWTEILPTTPLGPNAHHYLACADTSVWSHVRLHIYPDGGIARFRVYGKPELDRDKINDKPIDLACAINGGKIIAFSDAHYGSYHRLLAPGRGHSMGDGWETRRRREPGNDWIIIELAARGEICNAEIDTAFFKGNFPESCSIQGADLDALSGDHRQAIVASSMFWGTLLSRQRLSPDANHEFGSEHIASLGPVTHVLLNIFPDGGVSRLRLFGSLV